MVTNTPAPARCTYDLLDLYAPGDAEREYVRSLCDWRIAFVPEAGSVNHEPVGERDHGQVAGEVSS